jgi:hypothetical protein
LDKIDEHLDDISEDISDFYYWFSISYQTDYITI